MCRSVSRGVFAVRQPSRLSPYVFSLSSSGYALPLPDWIDRLKTHFPGRFHRVRFYSTDASLDITILWNKPRQLCQRPPSVPMQTTSLSDSSVVRRKCRHGDKQPASEALVRRWVTSDTKYLVEPRRFVRRNSSAYVIANVLLWS